MFFVIWRSEGRSAMPQGHKNEGSETNPTKRKQNRVTYRGKRRPKLEGAPPNGASPPTSPANRTLSPNYLKYYQKTIYSIKDYLQSRQGRAYTIEPHSLKPFSKHNGNLEGVERHLNTLRSATKRVDECKVQVEQAKIANGESFEEVTEWSLGVENKQTAADVNIEYLKNCLAEGKQRDDLLAKETEEAILQESRKKQLEFARTQLEMKLAYEKKIEKAKMSHAKTTEHSPHQMKTTKLPKLVIAKFRGELTDWPRFWSQFEAEVDRVEVPGVTKYS